MKNHFLLIVWAKLTNYIAFLLPYYLNYRQKKGKEIKERLKERLGYASLPAFSTKPIYFHAASIGELNSVLPLISKIHEQKPEQNFLVTTGTVTSFHIFQTYIQNNKNLAPFIAHQFIPLDVPAWIKHFLTYWKPSLIIMVESELWPNLIQQAHQNHIPLALINARLSNRSLKKWLYFPRLIQTLLSYFDWITPQSLQDQNNFQHLGIQTTYYGNLKQVAPKLFYNVQELDFLKHYFKNKPIWLAASTHATEENFIVNVHKKLRQKWPDLITILVPRHPERTPEILKQIGHVAQRSLQEMPFENGIWLCNTLGELGLFYHLVDITFIGNSLETSPTGGGHNPFEAIISGCAISTGPKIQNFTQAYHLLRHTVSIIHTEDDLVKWVDTLLHFPDKKQKLIKQGLHDINQDNELIKKIIEKLFSLQKHTS